VNHVRTTVGLRDTERGDLVTREHGANVFVEQPIRTDVIARDLAAIRCVDHVGDRDAVTKQ